MDDATALLEIEAIKRLKARYCRYLDTKDWQHGAGIFANCTRAEIELTSSTTARGIWALEDVVRFAPGVNLRGCHYHETYEKLNGQWHIASSTLTRLREDVFNVVVSVYPSDRLKKVVGRAARRLMQ